MTANLDTLSAKMAESYQQSDMDTCLETAEAILEINSDDIDALRYAARIYTNRKDQRNAQRQWARLIEVTPAAPEPYLQMARIMRQQKRWAECLEYIDNYLEFSPKHPEAVAIRVECHLNLKMDKKIGESFKSLALLRPREAAIIGRKICARGMGATIAPNLRALADAGDENAIVLCRNQAREERMAGLGFEIQKALDLAAQSYRTMRFLDPDTDYATTSLARLRKPFLLRARTAYQDHDDAQAIKYAQNCIDIEPQEAEPYLIAGRAAARSGDEAAAFRYLARGMDNCEPSIWLSINFARAAERSGAFHRAYIAFKDILESKDEEAEKYRDEAQRSFDRLPSRIVSSLRKKAEEGHHQEAIAITQSLADEGFFDEESFAALREHIANHAQRGLREAYDTGAPGAIEFARSLARFAPERDYAKRVAGRLLLNHRDYEEAAIFWRELCQESPESVEFHLNLARAYFRGKDVKNARDAIEMLLKLDPDHPEGIQMQDVLDV